MEPGQGLVGLKQHPNIQLTDSIGRPVDRRKLATPDNSSPVAPYKPSVGAKFQKFLMGKNLSGDPYDFSDLGRQRGGGARSPPYGHP